MPFKKGQSGNPGGRPKGSLNRATIACQALLSGEGQLLTERLIAKAKEGDVQALKICLDRLVAPRRDNPIPPLDLPRVDSPSDATNALNLILQAVARGAITPDEGFKVGALLGSLVKASTQDDPIPAHVVVESEIVWRAQLLEGLDHKEETEK